MRINPMNTMSFQAKIRPNKDNIEEDYTNIGLASVSTSSSISTTGASTMGINSFDSGQEPLNQSAEILNLTAPSVGKKLAHPDFSGATLIALGLAGIALVSQTNLIKDPSENADTLDKDDINIEEK